MLLRFRVANTRSFRDEQELSFVADPQAAPSVAQVVELSSGTALMVHPVIGVFGANASGKSNLLAALSDMRRAVLDSYALWPTYAGVPRDPFKLEAKHKAETSFAEVDFVVDAVRYTYGYELADDHVAGEWLHAYPAGRKQVWFDRDATRERKFDFKGNRLGPRSVTDALARRTRRDALFLTVAYTDNHPQLSPFYAWFRDNLWMIDPEVDRADREAFTERELKGARGERIRELLAVADLGISDVLTEVDEGGRTTIRLLHRGADGNIPFDWSQESFGTRSWFALLGPILLALDSGAVVMVDELDSSLHPGFAAEIVRLFTDPEVNTTGAQLLFTSHDATLLGDRDTHRLLGPDQVWLTVKDREGATELYPLSDADPGPNEDLERSYLLGRFGGVPRISQGQVGRRLRASKAEGLRKRA
ncbi:AAA family ATPase [Catenulispora pinisilvae]|uniref:AAA family ATPase n=1 Tax=Catenulispora pinisilvae TaxID=2705253 RepID=UPI0018913581|nr:ATP-binding protein [Catenulispora pinisilvae]